MSKFESWRQSEPVRLYLYPVLGLVLAYLVAQGILTADAADLVSAIAALVFGGAGIEIARSKVTSPATLEASKPPPGPSPEVLQAQLKSVARAVDAALVGGTPVYFPVLMQLRSQLARLDQ